MAIRLYARHMRVHVASQIQNITMAMLVKRCRSRERRETVVLTPKEAVKWNSSALRGYDSARSIPGHASGILECSRGQRENGLSDNRKNEWC